MAFQFRFDRLLKINESEKKQLEQIYSEWYDRLQKQGEKLVDLMERKTRLEADLERKKGDKITVSRIRELNRVLAAVGHQIAEEKLKYEQLRERLEAYRQALIEKSVEVKKFEKLKEWHWERYRAMQKRAELRFMDETAVQQHLKH